MKEQVNRDNRKGIIQSNKSSFATLYRLTDAVVIITIFYLCALFIELPIELANSVILFIGLIIYLLSAEALDLYRSWRTQSTTTLVKMTANTWAMTFVATLLSIYFFEGQLNVPREMALMWLVLILPPIVVWRIIFREVLFIARKQGRNTRSAAIIGATTSGYNLSTQIINNEQLGIQLFGVFDDRDESRLSHEFKSLVAGTIDDAVKAAQNGDIDYIYVAMPMSAEARIVDILRRCSDTTCSVYIIPDFFIYNLLNARWQSVGSVQTLSVYDTPFQGANNIFKRVEDIIFSFLILLLISPILAAVAIGVKLSSPGPVIFKQFRYGLDGRKNQSI